MPTNKKRKTTDTEEEFDHIDYHNIIDYCKTKINEYKAQIRKYNVEIKKIQTLIFQEKDKQAWPKYLELIDCYDKKIQLCNDKIRNFFSIQHQFLFIHLEQLKKTSSENESTVTSSKASTKQNLENESLNFYGIKNSNGPKSAWLNLFENNKEHISFLSEIQQQLQNYLSSILIDGQESNENKTHTSLKYYILYLIQKYGKESMEKMGYKIEIVSNENSGFYLKLKGDIKVNKDIMILKIDAVDRSQNSVSIEKENSKKRKASNSDQINFELLASNKTLEYPELQLKHEIYEIRIVTMKDGEYVMLIWEEERDMVFKIVEFLLKYLCFNPKEKALEFLNKLKGASFLLDIFEVFKNRIKNYEFRLFLNEMKKNYNYLNYVERCNKWMISNEYYISNDFYEELEEYMKND